ncbi:MAG: family 43 glycosylhydrolase [Oscillospiraceae bacterium]|nr:family 43 glycosylhydrolase [Oscillospiraceae bacterium]
MKRKISAFLSCVMLSAFTSVSVPFVHAAASPLSAAYADSAKRIISGAEYTIAARLSGKCMTADTNGNVIQWESLGTSAQHWKIVQQENGCCAILSAENPSMAMTIENGDATNGNNVLLTPYQGTDAQLFQLTRTADAYVIRGKNSRNAALDVYDISYENGANIDQWDYWGGEGQKFFIRPVEQTYSLMRGDLDRNDRIDARDLSLLKRGMKQGMDTVISKISDINGDGQTNQKDARALSRALCTGDMDFDAVCNIPYDDTQIAYLFAYFLGNAPEQERLSYAISLDGYHFTALNGGKAVWQSSVGTKCIRDPYIFKGEDGFYYLLATDMKSSLGWSSNRNLISAKSTDLIHWFDESLIEIANQYPNMMNCDRAWAPQAIYDPEKQSYMIYFAARVPGTDNRTIMYYAYSKDLKKLDTAPSLLFAPADGTDAIDSDIIYENGKYYMYFKNETNKYIYVAVGDHASGPYQQIRKVSEGTLGVEGPNIYKLLNSDEWLMMSDAYGNGYYVMQKTSDLENFTTVSRSDYSFDFTPRHGYVIPITAEQYSALLEAYPSVQLSTFNTGIEPMQLTFDAGDSITLPQQVNALYSDGSTSAFPVQWNQEQIKSLEGAVPGTYLVSGEVMTGDYDNPFISERADPYVVKGEDGYYYFTASYPAYGSVNKGYDRIILRRSKTVAGLAAAEEKIIWKAHADGIMSRHIWAPEMHYIGGAWYMYFAAGTSQNIWEIRPYVLKCDGDPYEGTWTECGRMQASSGDTESFAGFSLDMTYFENNGRHYVIWAEIKGDSSLFMAEINPEKPWVLISKPILLTKPEYNWELVNHRVNEGAAVLKHNGKIYVFFSASGTGSEYCVGKLSAFADADLMNPSSWTKYNQPVLSTADVNGESGPGHNSFVVDENGNLLIVYHARPSSHDSKTCGSYAEDPLYDPCRHTRIRQVFFGADGEPDIAMTPTHLLNAEYKQITIEVTIQ